MDQDQGRIQKYQQIQYVKAVLAAHKVNSFVNLFATTRFHSYTPQTQNIDETALLAHVNIYISLLKISFGYVTKRICIINWTVVCTGNTIALANQGNQ